MSIPKILGRNPLVLPNYIETLKWWHVYTKENINIVSQKWGFTYQSYLLNNRVTLIRFAHCWGKDSNQITSTYSDTFFLVSNSDTFLQLLMREKIFYPIIIPYKQIIVWCISLFNKINVIRCNGEVTNQIYLQKKMFYFLLKK